VYGDCVQLGVEAIPTALYKEEEATARRLQLESAVNVEHAQFGVSKKGAADCVCNSDRRVLEVVASFEFKLQIAMDVEADAPTQAEPVVGKIRLVVSLVGTESSDLYMLGTYCGRKAGDN